MRHGSQARLDAQSGDVRQRVEEVGDDLELVTKTNVDVDVVEGGAGQRCVVQGVGMRQSVLGRQVDEQRRTCR